MYHCLKVSTNLILQYCFIVNSKFIMIDYHWKILYKNKMCYNFFVYLKLYFLNFWNTLLTFSIFFILKTILQQWHDKIKHLKEKILK